MIYLRRGTYFTKLLTLISISLAIVLISGCKLTENRILRSATFQEKHYEQIIPFERKFKFINVKVGINGNPHKFDFMFDSGADGSVISKRIADSLGLKTVGIIHLRDLHKTSDKSLVIIPELDINGLKFYNIGAVVVDFGPNMAFNCVAQDGIIGANVISKCNWMVDFGEQILTATDSTLHFASDAITMPFYGAVPHINVQINEILLKNVCVDLGADVVYLPKVTANQNPGLYHNKALFRKMGYLSEGINGAINDTEINFISDSLQFGEIKLCPQKTVITNTKTECRIGNNFWDQYLLGLDYKKHELMISSRYTPPTDSSFKGMGFSLRMRDSITFISLLIENSPAMDLGLKINDQITEINGKPVNKLFGNYCDLLQWLKNDFPNMDQINLKVKGRKNVVVLKRTNYRPINNLL